MSSAVPNPSVPFSLLCILINFWNDDLKALLKKHSKQNLWIFTVQCCLHIVVVQHNMKLESSFPTVEKKGSDPCTSASILFTYSTIDFTYDGMNYAVSYWSSFLFYHSVWATYPTMSTVQGSAVCESQLLLCEEHHCAVPCYWKKKQVSSSHSENRHVIYFPEAWISASVEA